MSSLSTHNAQAEHNKKLSKQLSKTDFIDWSITCAFYAALHFVEAAFTRIPEILHTDDCYNRHRSTMASLDIDKSMHAFRETLIAKRFPSIRAKYHHLRVSSKAARYLLTTKDKPAFEFFEKSILKQLLKNLEMIQKTTQAS